MKINLMPPLRVILTAAFISLYLHGALTVSYAESNSESPSTLFLPKDTFDYTMEPLSSDSVETHDAWETLAGFNISELNPSGEFWLRIPIPSMLDENPAIVITAYLERFEVYSSSSRIYSWPDSLDFAYYKSHMIPVDETENPFNIYVRVFYSDVSGIGEIYAVLTGTKPDLIMAVTSDREAIVKSSMIEICQGFILFVAGIGCLMIFILRFREKEYPFFGFGFFSLAAGVTYLSGLHPLCYLNVSPAIYFYVKTVSFLLVPVGLFVFAESIFGKGTHSIIRRLWQFHLIFAMTAFLLIKLNIDYTWFIFFALVLNCSLCAIIILKSDSNSIPDYKIKISFAAFLTLFVALTIIQFLNFLNFIPWSYDLFGWGMLLFAFALGYTLIQHYRNTYNKMLNVSLELEKNKTEMLELQKEKLTSQLEALKNQLDPHFLFNNLSTLASIIEDNQDAAVQFINELSMIYRYVLQAKVHTLVALSEELDFINSYKYLMSKRFGENLTLSITVSEQQKQYSIAPFSLQLLVENAVKHNILSGKRPLNVDIMIENNEYLIVKNNLQKKNTPVESTGIGLENIKNRYKLLTDKEVSVTESETEFIVKIPIFTHSG